MCSQSEHNETWRWFIFKEFFRGVKRYTINQILFYYYYLLDHYRIDKQNT
jgi:hypothetical protein